MNDQTRSVPDLDPDLEPVANSSDNPTFASVLSARLHRRTLIKGSLGAALASLMGTSLAGSRDSNDDNDASDGVSASAPSSPRLGFQAVSVSDANQVLVPEGYTAKAFVPAGTPLSGDCPAYLKDGSNTGADQEHQVGANHDGMHFYPIDVKTGGASSTEGLLVLNHEYIDQRSLHASGPTNQTEGGPRPSDEVRKEVAAHGVSVIHIRKDEAGAWEMVPGSGFNRRITGATPVEICGPVRGFDKLVTSYSPDANRSRGTLGNCAGGPTPWNTYLAAEENWAAYFFSGEDSQPREHSRYGVFSAGNNYYWHTSDGDEDVYTRFDASVQGAAAADDYRNEPNNFGWMVEIDPFAPESVPQKRTALGRFAHEGVIFAPAVEGEPIVCYSGDDARFEYIYKFVSDQPYHADTAGGYLLNEGTLHVARFNDDGSGEWLPLIYGESGLTDSDSFTSQADVLVNTRLAADSVGATRMDRPEWGAIDPHTGEVYFTLTNNSDRTEADTNAANPLGPNPTGHIIRWLERDGNGNATAFDWDIFVFAGKPGTETMVDGETVAELDKSSTFNSPDGLWFDYNGRLWIQTDGSSSPPYQNNMMLAANPVTREIKRFFVGPVGCEVTGVVTTPDSRTMFVNVQHPRAYWPDASVERARSATMIVTRDDGGVIGA
ncbi:MAG: PhoX family phosphatase [Marinobacter sp.]|uniref:PhoX family phosphatase n=1 Tax=Marinobacter sp. TaxID=50741 RepID=UPI0034A01EE6